MAEETFSAAEVARRCGVTPATLKRWVRAGLIPEAAGGIWTSTARSHARVVARLRERGHPSARTTCSSCATRPRHWPQASR